MDLKIEDSRVSYAMEILIKEEFSGLGQALELLINEAMQYVEVFYNPNRKAICPLSILKTSGSKTRIFCLQSVS